MKNVLTALACLISVSVFGQGFTLYNQEFLSLNPSFVGIDSCYRVTKSYHKQWVGLQNSPMTFTASFDTNIKSHNGGFGISYNIEGGFGNETNTKVSGIYAHQWKINSTTKFIAAIQPDYYLKRLNSPNIWDTADPVIPDEGYYSSMGLSAGCLLYKPNFHIGITVDNIFYSGIGRNSLSISMIEVIKAHASGTISFGHNTYISPFCIVRTGPSDLGSTALDLGLLLQHQNYSLSLSVRPGYAITPGIRIEDDYYCIGYSYDIKIAPTSFGDSHTVGLAVYICSQKQRVSKSMFSSFINKIKNKD